MTDEKRFALRLAPELYKLIEQRAKKHLRSVNNEIIALLKLGLVNEMEEAKALDAADKVIPTTPDETQAGSNQ